MVSEKLENLSVCLVCIVRNFQCIQHLRVRFVSSLGFTFGLSCKSGMGSASFVTSVFGMTAASIVVREIRDSQSIH